MRRQCRDWEAAGRVPEAATHTPFLSMKLLFFIFIFLLVAAPVHASYTIDAQNSLKVSSMSANSTRSILDDVFFQAMPLILGFVITLSAFAFIWGLIIGQFKQRHDLGGGSWQQKEGDDQIIHSPIDSYSSKT